MNRLLFALRIGTLAVYLAGSAYACWRWPLAWFAVHISTAMAVVLVAQISFVRGGEPKASDCGQAPKIAERRRDEAENRSLVA